MYLVSRIYSYSLCSIFLSMYIWFFLFNNVIFVFYCYDYVFLLYVYVWLPWLRFFPCFYLSCKANARVKTAKTGHGPRSFKLFCCSMYFLCSMYCLFCAVPCIVCMYMCTVRLPPGGYPIAVKYIIFGKCERQNVILGQF